MPIPDADDIVHDALVSGRIDQGRSRLDAWQASQPVDIGTLSQLRYYRPLLGQYDEGIAAAKSMIQLRPDDAWQRMADHLRLGELYVAVGDLDKAWEALKIVLRWPELEDWFSAGLARSAVELALDISATASRDQELSDTAFETAVTLLDGGCSTSLVMLEKARDCSQRLGRTELFARFQCAADEERARIQRQLEGR